MKRTMSGLSAILLGVGLSVAVSAPARAAGATVTSDGTTVTVIGTADNDDLTYGVDCTTTACVQNILGTGVVAGAGCVQEFDFSVECDTILNGVISVSLGAGNDIYDVVTTDDVPPGTRITVDAGPGNDTLKGTGAIETWVMGEGDDKLEPDAIGGLDLVGPDDISGGPGLDHVDYLFTGADDLSGVRISFDDVANDGTVHTPDVDNVRTDVESVQGTNSDDTFVGNDLPQTISGASGNDTISGGGGDDVIDGRRGADSIDGGAGNDTIYGGPDNDTIVGGPGLDTINGDTPNLLDTGNDTINAVDGAVDYVACGPGSDSVSADDTDQIAAQAQDNCEMVALTATPGKPGTPGTPGTPGSEAVSVKGKKLDADKRRKKASIKVTCTSTTGCIGKVVAKKGTVVLAKGTYAVAAQKTGKVTVKITAKGRAQLARKKSVKVVVTLTPGGSSTARLTR